MFVIVPFSPRFSQNPVLVVGLFPVRFTGNSQVVISEAVATTSWLYIKTSAVFSQPPSITVHLNLFRPKPSPVTAVFSSEGVTTNAPPPSCVHVPVPNPGKNELGSIALRVV